jgi:hypothetical protein
MRLIFVALTALTLAACDASVSSKGGDAAADGYTMEIRADASQQTYLIVGPDGRTVGARAAEGASAVMDSARAQALVGDPPPRSGEDAPEVLSLRVPGFEMSVRGTDDGTTEENGQVQLSIGGGDGQHIIVDADEGGPGEADDRAYVRITGADEDAVRDFINDAEELSAEVKAQMLAELGLQ